MIGIDVGTFSIISCTRDTANNFEFKKEINAFLEIPLENRFVFNMMKNAGVPLIERDKIAYALGESACDMAYTMSNLVLRRPMADGCLNPKEQHAMQILSIMLHGLIDAKSAGDLVYYSVPANAINEETDADYHSKIIESILKAYVSETGYNIVPLPINEALALVYAELGDKAYSGIGVSCGGGMVNVCFALYGAPVFSFAIVNSGDWIDKMAAKATGEGIAFINKEKTKVDLLKEPVNIVERAIQTQYRLMIEKTVMGIKTGLENAGKSAKVPHPIDVIVAGGTSSPPGFDKIFKDVLLQANLPIPINSVIRPKDPMFSVAKGCLIAAENAV